MDVARENITQEYAVLALARTDNHIDLQYHYQNAHSAELNYLFFRSIMEVGR